jgi:hypothetical protein
MIRPLAALAILAVAALLFTGGATRPRARIGTYDSRAIAIAYGNSEEGASFITGLMKEYRAAKDAKNDSLVAALEERGQMHQRLSHMRAFSTAPVDELFEAHAKDVEAIARKAGVEAVVPAFQVLWCDDGVEKVDLTEQLAAMFKPSAQGLKWVKECRGSKPLPLLEALLISPME